MVTSSKNDLQLAGFHIGTWAMRLFVVSFFMLSIVTLNVLVRLTVDNIRNVQEDADLLQLSKRLKFVIQMERHHIQKMITQPIDTTITRNSLIQLPQNQWPHLKEQDLGDDRKEAEAEKEES